MSSSISFLISTLTILYLFSAFALAHDERKVYIAYMGTLPEDDYSPLDHHTSILQEVLESSSPANTLIRSYKRSFNGFAANLTGKESKMLKGMKGVVSVFLSRKYKLLTTRSWDFLRLGEDVKRVPDVESDVIVGIIDNGIWPESESFSDQGFGPPPKRWNGVCNGGENFTCNNKIIGARYYGTSTDARDRNGHGSHTASTVAGRLVNNVSFYGLAQGTARGGVPSARIAVYKVCTSVSCETSDILAAFDDAISDGVDLLSVSLGIGKATGYLVDPVSIGAFHALKKGIFTSQSAGNSGPSIFSVSSIAPWILSVAASTLDRKIVDKVVLGDNTTFEGLSVNAFPTTEKLLLVANGSRQGMSESLVGKIVYYDGFNKGDHALAAHASGMIVNSDDETGFSRLYPLPTALVSTRDGDKIKSYIKNDRKPVASILKSENLKDSSAPAVTSFSSRGPSIIDHNLLKPDITAPGSNIIAAWSPEASPSGIPGDKRSVNYNIISGTSMSCPHATAAAAYVKTFHPNWSPAAIKSALMTTAYPLADSDESSHGSGHIDPVKAVDPGLIYDAEEGDYVKFLCNRYSADELILMTGDKNTTCPKNKVPIKDLNYPSIGLEPEDTNFTRTVTNVGAPNSKYTATITSPSDWNISVEPKVLSFKFKNEKKSFIVTISVKKQKTFEYSAAGSLVWSDGIHNVRSPIVVQKYLSLTKS